jgi:CRP-like cAMP-binding protein
VEAEGQVAFACFDLAQAPRLTINRHRASPTTRNSARLRRTFKNTREFDVHAFLATIGEGRKAMLFRKKETIFVQGDPADTIFYLQTGKVRLTVVSKTGKEATIGILNEGSFFGEGSLAGQPLRMCSATAMTDSSVLRIEKRAMVETLQREPHFPIFSWRICWRVISVMNA